MLTPQEVSERAFQKASFGGYNMGRVDELPGVLTGDYCALYSENAVLKSKMKVLVDKVEEYRSTEEATAANQAQQAQETEQDQSQPEADLSDTAEFSPVSAQPQPEEQAQEEDVPPARRDGRIDFGSLQFGRDYEIK